MFATSQEALKYIADEAISMIDLKVTGVLGQWLHITIPARSFTAKHFEEGVGYDGSSGAGFGKVESGDVAARPIPASAFLDPFWERPTLSFLCDTVTADTKQPFPADPRTIAQRAVEFMRQSGAATEALMGPEFEFHVFDSVDTVSDPYECGVRVVCSEVHNEGTSPTIARKGGYMRVPPAEHLHDFRSEVAAMLGEMNIPVRYHHHEVGAPGQCEIEVDLCPLVQAADNAMIIKYVVKNLAYRHGKIATFMPKPIFGEAGNGMHVHQRLEADGENLFFHNGKKNYADLSDTALHYIAGLLAHGRALSGLVNPSTNSFKRLVEGYEAPVNLFFSLANRSAAIRVPRYAIGAEEKRIEYRPPDFTGNIYVTLAAMLMAGLDGVASKLDPSAHNFGPFDVDIAQQDEAFRSKITPLPRTLLDALDALAEDRSFLSKGEVFPAEFLDAWMASKQANDVRSIATRPHPYEFDMYLDV